jgi:uncharacterized protein (DUF2141 family)
MLKKITILLLLILKANLLLAFTTTINISNADKKAEGTLYLVVTDEANFKNKSYKKNKSETKHIQKITKKDTQIQVILKDLPQKDLIFFGFVDTNNNQKLDTNFIGMPKEPVFFTKKLAGPPSFNSLKTTLTNQDLTLNLIVQ